MNGETEVLPAPVLARAKGPCVVGPSWRGLKDLVVYFFFFFFSSRAGRMQEVMGPLEVWKPRRPPSSVALGCVDGGAWERG